MQIPKHHTWDVVDSSKLTCLSDCPRQFFYQYILAWRPDRPEHDLHFGESWHHAREHQLLNGYEDIKGAYYAFLDCYRDKFQESTDDLFRPKDPTAVVTALTKFAEERKSDLTENELLLTECSGKVPISNSRYLHYRMDSILRQRSSGKIFSWDHKSATERSINYPWWADNFLLSLQNGTYTHCLYCMYPIEEVLGIEFCGTSFHYLPKGGRARSQGYHITFKRVPAYKTPDQMNAWLWTVNDLYDYLEREMEKLFKCKPSDPVLQAFPMAPGTCSKYRGCPYHDFCITWPNPLRSCDEPPLGFKQEYWNPAEIQTTNKKDLEWKGE